MSPGASTVVSAIARAACACGAAAVLCLLLSCSTAPKTDTAPTGVKTQAAQDAANGDGYLRQGRYVLALQFYTQALSEYTSIDDEVGIVTCYNAVGRTYLGMGSLDMAADMFTRALDRAPDASPSLRFVATNNLGELALARGDATGALSLFQEALAMPPKARTDQETGILYHNLGTAEKNLGSYAEALSWYQKSLDINLPHKLTAEAASDYYMIASVHSLQGSFDDAAANAQKALALDKQVENSPGIAQDLYALGLIARKRGDLSAAFDWFQRSYLVYTTLSSPPATRKVLADLAAAADSLGRTQDADAYRSALAALGSP
jgi:tetratricopeptide (TPR) repeat protein